MGGRHINTVEQTTIWDRYEAGDTFTEVARPLAVWLVVADLVEA